MPTTDISLIIDRKGEQWRIEWDGFVAGEKIAGLTEIRHECIDEAFRSMGVHLRYYMDKAAEKSDGRDSGRDPRQEYGVTK